MNLSECVMRRIGQQGTITYEEFIDLLLYDEDWGYYRRGKKEGKDFLTSPEIHPAFGQALGRYFSRLAHSLKEHRFSVLELGGAGGGLARQIVSSLDPSVLARYVILEKGRRAPEGPIEWVENLSDLPACPDLTFVVANEFFDALPFHRVINRGGILSEIYLGFEQGFFEVTGEPTPAVAAFLQSFPLDLDKDQSGEVTTGMASVVGELSALLGRAMILVFDYGYHWNDLAWGRFSEGTMVGYMKMGLRQNIFDSPGSMDVTHHVNFDHLSALLKRNGWRRAGECEQYRFLINIGILDILVGLEERERVRAKALIDPQGLGSTMTALTFMKGLDGEVPGFEARRALA